MLEVYIHVLTVVAASHWSSNPTLVVFAYGLIGYSLMAVHGLGHIVLPHPDAFDAVTRDIKKQQREQQQATKAATPRPWYVPTILEPWITAHGGHHKIYGAGHFFDLSGYIANHWDKCTLNTYLYVGMLVVDLALIGRLFVPSADETVSLLCMVLCLFWLEQVVHNAIHEDDGAFAHLDKFEFVGVRSMMCRLWRIHFVHHRLLVRNFAAVAWWFDWSCGTLMWPADSSPVSNLLLLSASVTQSTEPKDSIAPERLSPMSPTASMQELNERKPISQPDG
jgi:hypothetical protein